jgi:hypothetical protein
VVISDSLLLLTVTLSPVLPKKLVTDGSAGCKDGREIPIPIKFLFDKLDKRGI